MSSSDYHEEANRRRLDQQGTAAPPSGSPGTASATADPSTSQTHNGNTDALSDSNIPSPSALMYHMAVSAHRHSRSHLQQAFIPGTIEINAHAVYPPILASTGPSTLRAPFTSDHLAATKAFALLLFALDLLSTGLKSNQLLDRERVAFTIEFAIIATKAARSLQRRELKMAFPSVDPESIIANASDLVNISVSVSIAEEAVRPSADQETAPSREKTNTPGDTCASARSAQHPSSIHTGTSQAISRLIDDAGTSQCRTENGSRSLVRSHEVRMRSKTVLIFSQGCFRPTMCFNLTAPAI